MQPQDDAIVCRWRILAGRIKRDTGQPPSVIDTLLAATATKGGLYLVTRNTRAARLAGTLVFNLWNDDTAEFRLVWITAKGAQRSTADAVKSEQSACRRQIAANPTAVRLGGNAQVLAQVV